MLCTAIRRLVAAEASSGARGGDGSAAPDTATVLCDRVSAPAGIPAPGPQAIGHHLRQRTGEAAGPRDLEALRPLEGWNRNPPPYGARGRTGRRLGSPGLSSMSARVALGLVAAVGVAVGSAGCGSSGHNGLSSADAARLRADIAAARTAAARHEAPQAASSLVALRQQVSRLAAQHKLTPSQAQALETGAEQAQARIALDVETGARCGADPGHDHGGTCSRGTAGPGASGQGQGTRQARRAGRSRRRTRRRR